MRVTWFSAFVYFALCFGGAAYADVFAYVDADGVTHFSNVPTDPRYQLVLSAPPPGGEPRRDTGAAVELNGALLARAERYEPYIKEAARVAEVDSRLLHAVIVVESAFDERAVSKRGARGLMQLMPATARRYGVRDSFNPGQNIRAGAAYLRDLLDRYGDDLQLVLAAYNAGEAAVDRHGRAIPPFKETQAYVPRVLGVYAALCRITQKT